MNCTDLRGITPDKMEKHIRDATANRMLIDASPDRMAALEAIMARANLVWAVWFENDRRKPKLLGHALAIAKGIPLMQRIPVTALSG